MDAHFVDEFFYLVGLAPQGVHYFLRYHFASAHSLLPPNEMKRILLIAQFFPPTGGAGVQRSSKFVKYLPDYGILPVVLTGLRNPEHSWTPEDDSLVDDIPADVEIYRAHWSLDSRSDQERRDRKVFAFMECAERAIRDHNPELILVTMSPFMDAEIAAALSKKHGLPWIADLRDPWGLDEFQIYRSFLHRRLEVRLMRVALKSASGIIMNTPVARDRLLSSFPDFADRPVTAITNGFDADDFPQEVSVRPRKERFRIVHTGTFHTKMGMHQESNAISYKLLGRCRKGVRLLPRSPKYLLQALSKIADSDPEMMALIEIIFAGVMSPADLKLIEESGLSDHITVTGYVGHDVSTQFARSADLLFLPLHTVDDREETSIVPGKTYEYIATGCPILGALPNGDAKRFVEDAGNCWVVDPEDVEGLEQGIRNFFDKWQDGTITYHRDPKRIAKFERLVLTRDLAEFLRGCFKLT